MIWLGAGTATIGAVLCLLGAIGLIRLPDALSRLQVVTKASALGVVFSMIGTVLALPTLEVLRDTVMIAFFLLLSTPISAHLVGRAAYRSGLTGRLRVDEFKPEE